MKKSHYRIKRYLGKTIAANKMKTVMNHRTTLILLLLTANTAQAESLKLDDLFPLDRVLDVRITVTKEGWNTIRRQRREFQNALGAKRQFAPPESPYTYVKGKMTIDGVDFGEVGVRKKGFLGSQSALRPSLKIKLNYVQKNRHLDGLTSLTFNNNRQDRT